MATTVGHIINRELRGDKAIWVIVFLLTLASLLAVYSSSGSMAFRNNTYTELYLVKHFIFISFGLVLMYVCYKTHYMIYNNLAPLLVLISIPILLYTLFFGVDVNEARRWIQIPVLDLTFQTSDFAKLALIVYLARSISQKQDHIKDFNTAFVPLILPVIVICGLIAPSDLSTAMLLFATCVLMMFIGRVDLKYIALLFGFGFLLLSLLIVIGTFVPEMVRVSTWISRVREFFYDTDGGYQIQQAKIAISQGEWFGVGPGNSVQRNFLPYPYADFIYAIICEEYGLFGGFTIIALYFLLIWRSTAIVTKSPKAFGAMLAIGLGLNIAVPAFANIAVSLDLVPVTGLTLPMVSMGGTSLLFTCISFGIILSVSKYVERVREHKMQLEELENLNESHH